MVRKKKGKLIKIILPLLFLLLIVLLIIFNKSTVQNLVPIDYIVDPWPTQQSCDLPEVEEKK